MGNHPLYPPHKASALNLHTNSHDITEDNMCGDLSNESSGKRNNKSNLRLPTLRSHIIL